MATVRAVTCPPCCGSSPHQPRCALWQECCRGVASALHTSAGFGAFAPHTPVVTTRTKAQRRPALTRFVQHPEGRAFYV